MKKRFGSYVIGWGVLLALFNVIAFVSPGWIGCEKYGAAFWIGYGFITVTFFGQLVCAWFALKEESANMLFYKISLITTSYTGLIATFVIGGLCMLIPALPSWLGVLACSIVLVANILAVLKSVAAIDEVQRVDAKVKAQTSFIRTLTADAEALMAKAKDEAAKAECKKVYEAVRYSDPMSSDALAAEETEIARAFAKLADAVSAEDAQSVTDIGAELIVLISNRNKKCKLLK